MLRFNPAFVAWQESWRPVLLIVASCMAVALTGCATTRYYPTYCISQQQYRDLEAKKPPKVHGQLSGQADHDIKPIAGRLIRMEAWGDGLLHVLDGCVDPKK